MKRYDSYKDSGVKWLGEIPSHWEIKPLGKVCYFTKGLQFTKADLVENGIPVVSYGQVHAKYNSRTHLSNDLIRFVPEPFIKGNDNSKVLIGDFVVADTSEDVDGCGNMAFNDCKDNLYAGYHTIIIKDVQIECKKYLAYLFNSCSWRSQIRSLVNGVKVYTVNRDILKKSNILYPSKNEQEAIASYLDAATSKIDEAIAKQHKMIDLLNERKQIIINNAVTKGLDSNVKMKPSGIDWIGDIPEHWEVLKLKYLGTIKSGDGIKNEDLHETGEYPVWGGNGLIGYTNLYNKDNNAIIIGRVGALCGNVRYLTKPTFVTDNALIYSIKGKIDHLFLLYTMKAANLNSLNTSNAQPLITGSKVKNVAIPFPRQDEQKSIVSFLTITIDYIDKIVNKYREQISLLQERKQIIINDVVTGKVKVI